MLGMSLSTFPRIMRKERNRAFRLVTMKRKEFLKEVSSFLKSLFLLPYLPVFVSLAKANNEQKPTATNNAHYYGMAIKVNKCIGCGQCVEACKNENKVPKEPFFFRTWVERYTVLKNENVVVDSPNGGMGEYKPAAEEKEIMRSFFVPKLCNHCDNPPCVQVCPVGATFKTNDGVILVDDKYCIGCRYCIQACPYGARYFHPVKKVADKCTFCYHRITKGLLPACVEVCPTKARIFGDAKTPPSPIVRLLKTGKISVLKNYMNTEPKVYYSELDGVVR